MDDYDGVADAMGRATGKDVRYDEAKYAYVVIDGGEEVVVGYADEDLTEIVDNLLRM